jgi:hypothetical protein
MLMFAISAISMIVAVGNLVLGNWMAMCMSILVATLNGVGFMSLGPAACYFDDKLLEIEAAETAPRGIETDPLYATWDQIIGFHTVDRVLADLPELIRADFEPAALPCPSTGQWHGFQRKMVADRTGKGILWICRDCGAECRDTELAIANGWEAPMINPSIVLDPPVAFRKHQGGPILWAEEFGTATRRRV